MFPHVLHPVSLTVAAFAPFGQVLGLESGAPQPVHSVINDGHALRYDLVPDLQLTADRGVPMLALFRAAARNFPLLMTRMERHRLGSQTFVPLGVQRFVVVVAPATSACTPDDVRAFITNGRQGVVLAPGTWHHALLAVDGGDFVVVERRAAQVDCEVTTFCQAVTLSLESEMSDPG